IGGTRSRCPVPTDAADLAGIQEIVQRYKFAGNRMMIRRQGLGEFREGRISIAGFEIAEHLIVGPVLLDHLDYMLDWPSKFSHHRIDAGVSHIIKPVILDHPFSQGFEFGKWRDRKTQQASFLQRVDVLVWCFLAVRNTWSSDVGAAISWVWTGDAF